MKERILELIAALNLSMRSFSFRIEMSEGYVRNMSKNIGVDVVGKILLKFPDVNPYWLILGEGDMFIINKMYDSNRTVAADNTSNVIGNNVVGDRAIFITMPETGSQKIIKPDGEVIIESTESIDIPTALHRNSDTDSSIGIEALQEKIKLLEEIIRSKNEMIELLKKQLDK